MRLDAMCLLLGAKVNGNMAAPCTAVMRCTFVTLANSLPYCCSTFLYTTQHCCIFLPSALNLEAESCYCNRHCHLLKDGHLAFIVQRTYNRYI